VSSNLERVKFDEGNTLKLDFNKFNKHYGINLKIKQDQKEEQNLSFEFKIKSKIVTKNTSILNIDRINLKINDEKPNHSTDELAYKCGKVIYPIEVLVTNNFELLKVLNHEAILTKWIKTKKEILKEDTNKSIIWYIEQMEKSIIEKELIIKTLKKDYFLAALFAPIYTDYAPLYNFTDVSVKVPLIPFTKSINFSVKQKVKKVYTTYNTITVEQKGEIDDGRSAYEIVTHKEFGINNGEKAKGDINVTYQIEKESKVINSIIGNYSINLPYNESRFVELRAFDIKENNI